MLLTYNGFCGFSSSGSSSPASSARFRARCLARKIPRTVAPKIESDLAALLEPDTGGNKTRSSPGKSCPFASLKS
jgi:hypothetical protein